MWLVHTGLTEAAQRRGRWDPAQAHLGQVPGAGARKPGSTKESQGLSGAAAAAPGLSLPPGLTLERRPREKALPQGSDATWHLPPETSGQRKTVVTFGSDPEKTL